MDSRDADAAALRRELRSRLGLLGAPLQLLGEDLLGEEDARIDWVAMEPDGRVCVVLVSEKGDERLLALGLAQRAWVQARIGDWRQLAPWLSAGVDLRPRLLLLARDFSRIVRLAAREADSEGLRLARFRWEHANGREPELTLEALDPLPVPNPPPASASAPLASVFRSALGERDFSGGGGGPPPS
ncbi:MAG TPA: hypothetical protein VLC53_12825 [Myxococcota bacterium]|nr:hypothetical protein [Myxococcota bacterium]